MSGGSVDEIADRFIRAWSEKKPELFVEHCDPDVELLLPRNLLEGGSYKGHDGVRQAFADGFAMWKSFSGAILDVREGGDRFVLLGRSVQVPRHGGPRVDYELAWVFRTRDGKVVQLRPFLSHEEALEAAGLG